MENYKCYGCEKVAEYSQFFYECICLHHEYPNYRGVCRDCVASGKEIRIPPYHSLMKIHQYSREYQDFWNKIQTDHPNWTGFHFENDKMVLIVSGDVESFHKSKKVQLDISSQKFADLSKCICCSNF